MTRKAVVLAAGRGTRMQRAGAANLTEAQRSAAERGLKAMIPVGRPFLDYVLSGLADAGYQRVCLVIAPGHQEVREHYETISLTRIEVEFALQPQPRGTADAVLAAERFADRESVVVLNADNLYPGFALQRLRALPRAGLLGFRRSTLIEKGDIPAERIAAYALVEVDGSATLSRIVEKPDSEAAASFGADPLVSMNAWLLPPSIFEACRAVTPSPRGELELQDAVRYSSETLGERYQVIESNQSVLDLSSQDDIAGVAERVRALEVRL